MDPDRPLRRVAASALFAVVALVLAVLFWPDGDAWSAIARFIVGTFLLPMALGLAALAFGVLRGMRGSEWGALVLLVIVGAFLGGSSAGVERALVIGAVVLCAAPLVLLLVPRSASAAQG